MSFHANSGSFKPDPRSLKERFDERWIPEPMSGCWLWMGPAMDSLGRGGMWAGGKTVRAHRVSWMVYRDSVIPRGFFVCHRCDNHACVNPDHLFLGRAKDNSQDMAMKGRSARGVKQHLAKLTEAEIPEIRELERNGIHQRVIAKRYGVSQVAIWAVLRGETWRHVQ